MDAAERIRSLKKDRNALILAHNYCRPEVQDIADHVGDSLGLSIIASEAKEDVIVFCGVSFMAESAKILNPSKKVLIPEPDAHCPMASMCTADQLDSYKKNNPSVGIAGYVNSTASSKTKMDLCCTSSNAVKAVGSMKEKKILFVPDKNLGAYVASNLPGKEIELWDGYCPIHHGITEENILSLKERHPKAIVLAHPECRPPVLKLADHIGSTERILNIVGELNGNEFIIVTEEGMRHRLEKRYPGTKFYFVENAVCITMKMTTINSVLRCLEKCEAEVTFKKKTLDDAYVPLKRMIEIK
jgi:quinolinate synthetase complex, A subunit